MPIRALSGHGPPRLRAALLLVLICLLGANRLSGKDIYVDSFNGSPGGDGSANQPLDTIQAGVDIALDGDRVVVARGTYDENVVISGRRVDMLAPDGPFLTTIDGGGLASVLFLDNAADSVITGFRLTNGAASFGGGVEVLHGNPTVSHCVITGNSAVTDTLGYGGLGAGVDIFEAPGAIVRDSLIVGNTAEIGGGGVNVVSSNFATVTFNTIHGNATTDPSAGYGPGVHVVGGGGLQVTNNLITGNTGSNNTGGLEIFGASVTIVGNILYGNLPTDYVSTECPTPPCPVPPENQVADPRYVAPASGNFRLRLDSPGIDWSDPNIPPSPLDIDQNPRPIDSDMDGQAVPEPGCFEQLGQVTNVNVSGSGLVTWDPAFSPPQAYHVYRSSGAAVAVRIYGACQDARDPDLTDTQFDETDDPPLGETFTFLVTFTLNGAESSMGLATDGILRVPSVPCP